MANYISNRTWAQWYSMWQTYINKYYKAAGYKYNKAGALRFKPIENVQPLKFEEFKTKYILARNTNIAATGRAGDVYKTLIERDISSPYQLTRKQARVLQEQMKLRGDKKVPTIAELRLKGGTELSNFNKYLKTAFPQMKSKDRAKEISQIFFGSK